MTSVAARLLLRVELVNIITIIIISHFFAAHLFPLFCDFPLPFLTTCTQKCVNAPTRFQGEEWWDIPRLHGTTSVDPTVIDAMLINVSGVHFKRIGEEQYASIKSALDKTLRSEGWQVKHASFIAGARSLNEPDLCKNLEFFKIPQASIESIRSKLAWKIFDEYTNILKGMYSIRFNGRPADGGACLPRSKADPCLP